MNYKDGRTLKKYYCIKCNKKISYKSAHCGEHRCKKCAAKERAKKSIIHYYCMDCGRKVNSKTTLRCRKCWSIYFAKNQIGNQYGKFTKGIKRTKETKAKISRSLGGTGIPYENTEYSQLFRNIREKIRKRDNYTCQLCGHVQLTNEKQLDVHHIDYNKQNCKENNLISLCMSCHRKTNTNRNKWINYFKEIMQCKKLLVR